LNKSSLKNCAVKEHSQVARAAAAAAAAAAW